MSTTRGVTQLTINNTQYALVDNRDASGNEIEWATAEDVYRNKYFMGRNGVLTRGIGEALQEKTVSAGTQPVDVLPDEGYVLSKVTVNAIKAEVKDDITPSDSEQIIEPSEGSDFLSKVVIKPISTKKVEVTPESGRQTFNNSDGNYISEVVIAPVPTEEARVQSAIGTNVEATVITPTQGKFFSQVTIQPIIGTIATITPAQERQTIYPEWGEYYSQIEVAGIQTKECSLNPLETGIWEATPEEGQYYTKVVITKIPRYSGKMEVR